MRHEFQVPFPASRVWPALVSADLLARVVPDLVVEEVAHDRVRGRLKVRFGSTSITYRGEASLRETDTPRMLRVDLSGVESRSGAASLAELTVQLAEADQRTTVLIEGDVTLAGRATQLRPLTRAAGGRRMLERFADRFATLLAEQDDAVAEASPPKPAVDAPSAPASALDGTAVIESPRPLASVAEPSAETRPATGEDDPLDLLGVSGRAAPLWAAAVALGVALLVLVARAARRLGGRDTP